MSKTIHVGLLEKIVVKNAKNTPNGMNTKSPTQIDRKTRKAKTLT